MILFKNGCYAVAGALLLVVAGLAGFGGVDAMYAQGWMIVLLIVFAISGLIVEIDQHVFPDKPPAAEEEPVTAASPAAIPHAGTSPTRVTRWRNPFAPQRASSSRVSLSMAGCAPL